jgi:hypothetical protein
LRLAQCRRRADLNWGALGIVIAAITYLSNWIDQRRPALVGENSASGED